MAIFLQGASYKGSSVYSSYFSRLKNIGADKSLDSTPLSSSPFVPGMERCSVKFRDISDQLDNAGQCKVVVSKRGSEKPVKSEPPRTLLYLYGVNRRFSPLRSFLLSLSFSPFLLPFHGCGATVFSTRVIYRPDSSFFPPTAAYLCPPPPFLSTRLTRIRTTDGACKRWVGAQGGAAIYSNCTRCRRIFLVEFLYSFSSSDLYGSLAALSPFHPKEKALFSAIKHKWNFSLSLISLPPA